MEGIGGGVSKDKRSFQSVASDEHWFDDSLEHTIPWERRQQANVGELEAQTQTSIELELCGKTMILSFDAIV